MAMQSGTEIWRGQVRVPRPIAEWVQSEAKKNFRSTNAEIVELLKSAQKAGLQNAAQ